MTHYFKPFIFSMLVSTILVSNLQAAPVVGFVSGLNDKPDVYTLIRNGQNLPMYLLMPLQQGDQITVVEKSTILLKIEGKEIEVKQEIYTVKSTATISWFKSAENIGRTITKWFKDSISKTVIKIRTGDRGNNDTPSDIPAPYITLLEWGERRALVAGKRPLYLAWGGGKAPFYLTIQQAGNNSPVILGPFKEQRIKTPDLDLTAVGDYDLKVCDAQEKCSENYTFAVVDKSEPPKYPHELTDSRIPEMPRFLVQAFWLAAQERRKWAFEAYQQIAPLAESEQPARILRDALEIGKPIQLPKKSFN
ncbi:hypothetical protein PN36_14410 [Candidatus Thiomargarita nelsonii]|uniref:Secreted protein n=1 Tax=Candidatus Thiomargarita nelsonii TaxID=1003181 RepID=A0A0A6PH39_9GAMM|nr:hypothetical protein PN36_14410 [Candidatus Thiomargarita nelsonii]